MKNQQRGGIKVDNLVAGIADGKRSFRILRQSPDGKSYAHDIAEKYNLSLSQIMEKLGGKIENKT